MAEVIPQEDEKHRLGTLATLNPKAYEKAPVTVHPEIFPWHDFTTLPDKNILTLSDYLERSK